jgi:4-amino-4-deoxy-L-arabinose transferase-like glycosyltransferase
MKIFNDLLNAKIKFIAPYLIVLVICFLILFLKLGSFHMRWWDESMFAVNTYEMMQNGNYFTLFFDGSADLFNTKPPLTNWFQVLSCKIFGYNEFAIRFPSAMASTGTVLLVFAFVKRHFSQLMAFASVLILLTSFGFVHFHTSRTGDSDALLTFFMTAMNLCFIQFILSGRKRLILYFFLALMFAFSTKLYAGLLFVPAYIGILLYAKKMKVVFSSWQTYVGLVLFLGVSFLLIAIRSEEVPGYLSKIWGSDAGRLFSADYHSQEFSFYFQHLFGQRYGLYMIITLIASVLVFILHWKQKEQKAETLKFIFFLAICYLAIITFSSTKLTWYDMPLYPLLAILGAFTITKIIEMIEMDDAKRLKIKQYLILGLIFLYPFVLAFNKSQGNTVDVGERMLEANERYLYKAIKEERDVDGLKVYYTGWKGSLLFYKYKLQEEGVAIELQQNLAKFEAGDRVLVCHDSLKSSFHEKFHAEVVDSYQTATVLQIINEK